MSGHGDQARPAKAQPRTQAQAAARQLKENPWRAAMIFKGPRARQGRPMARRGSACMGSKRQVGTCAQASAIGQGCLGCVRRQGAHSHTQVTTSLQREGDPARSTTKRNHDTACRAQSIKESLHACGCGAGRADVSRWRCTAAGSQGTRGSTSATACRADPE